MICEQYSVRGHLEVEGVPLVVVILLNVNSSVNDWLTDVKEEEGGDDWIHHSCPVSGETNVDHSVSFERGPCLPKSSIVRFLAEWNSLLSETLDILIDSALELWFDLVSLDHLHNLLLLFVSRAISGTNLSQTKLNVVL